MSHMTISDYDSRLFGHPVFKLNAVTTLTPNEIARYTAQAAGGRIFCFTPVNYDNCRHLTGAGFALINIRAILSRPMNLWPASGPVMAQDFTVNRWSKHRFDLSSQELKQIARVIGKTSRYYKDKLIPRKVAENVYVEWLNNCLYHDYANEVFYIRKHDRLLAILTMKLKHRTVAIDLLGVAQQAQRQGLGTALLHQACRHYQSIAETMEVVTEGENLQAMNFYLKHGFAINQTALVYHWQSSK